MTTVYVVPGTLVTALQGCECVSRCYASGVCRLDWYIETRTIPRPTRRVRNAQPPQSVSTVVVRVNARNVQSVCSGAGLNRSMVHVGCVLLFDGRTGEDNLEPIIKIRETNG